MKKEQIIAANADERIRLLYQTAFPENEQIPWPDLMRLIDQMHLDFTVYYEENELIGLTIVYQDHHSTGSGILPSVRS